MALNKEIWLPIGLGTLVCLFFILLKENGGGGLICDIAAALSMIGGIGVAVVWGFYSSMSKSQSPQQTPKKK